jgi:hypothetical protein
MKKKRISATLSVVVDLKVGENTDIKNVIERLECKCMEMSGEEAEIIDMKILDRKLLIEGEDDD